MGIVGVLWVIFIVLKIVGVIFTSWWIILLWPLAVVVVILFLSLVLGVTVAGFSSLRR